MMTLQLRLGRTLLAARHCGQQTNNFIEWPPIRANAGAFFLLASSETEPSSLCSFPSCAFLLPCHFCAFSFAETSNYSARGRNLLPTGGRLKLISLNVALPRLAMYRTQTVSTGIFKQPVPGPVQLRTLNLDGDRQADLTVHGGPCKAV